MIHSSAADDPQILTTGPGEHSDVSYIYTHTDSGNEQSMLYPLDHQKITTNVIVYKCRTC